MHKVWDFESTGKLVKEWAPEGELDDPRANAQILNVAKLPHVKRIAVMPDKHAGKGCTVGTAIAMEGAVTPSIVGVDIGCGVDFLRTSLSARDITGRFDLGAVRRLIELRVPAGFFPRGQRDGGSWGNVPDDVQVIWDNKLAREFEDVTSDLYEEPLRGLYHDRAVNQLGTLGSGNHFVELSADENDAVWVLVHSGSRGPGNKVGQYFINEAKRLCKLWMVPLPDPDLAYLPEGTDQFNHYMQAVSWAQEYARQSRRLMMNHVLGALNEFCNETVQAHESHSCHHNYIQHENVTRERGHRMLVARKGAVKAGKGDIVIIPGSMGARTYIAEGLGNEDSMQTCAHGAGRRMSRTQAKREIKLETHIQSLNGVECDKTAGTIDESPAAYKSIESVMAALTDPASPIVKPLHRLKQFLCIKGKDHTEGKAGGE